MAGNSWAYTRCQSNREHGRKEASRVHGRVLRDRIPIRSTSPPFAITQHERLDFARGIGGQDAKCGVADRLGKPLHAQNVAISVLGKEARKGKPLGAQHLGGSRSHRIGQRKVDVRDQAAAPCRLVGRGFHPGGEVAARTGDRDTSDAARRRSPRARTRARLDGRRAGERCAEDWPWRARFRAVLGTVRVDRRSAPGQGRTGASGSGSSCGSQGLESAYPETRRRRACWPASILCRLRSQRRSVA